MKRSTIFILAGIFVLGVTNVSVAVFPPAGQDNINTKGFFKFRLLDGTMIEFTLGPDPTVIGRSAPHAESDVANSGAVIDNGGFTMLGSGIAPDPVILPDDWPEGDPDRREVHTEILDLSLTNGTQTLRVGQAFWDSLATTPLRDQLYGNSFGEVTSNDSTGDVAKDFPAQGIFNVCAEFEDPIIGKVYNKTPMLIRKTRLLGFPPDISNSATTYLHDPSFMGATFFNTDGIPIGKLLSAGHGATSVPDGTRDALPPISCPVSFTVDRLSIGLANILPNQVNIDNDDAGGIPRKDVTVYVSRSGTGPVGPRPGIPDGSNALSGSFTGDTSALFPDFVSGPAGDAITSFSYGQDGTIPTFLAHKSIRGNIYFSLDKDSPPSQGVCFGVSAVGANIFASITPSFGSYVDVIQPAALFGTNLLVVDNNELGLSPAFDETVDDEVTGLELKDEIQLNPASLFWFGTLSGPANSSLGGNAATIYVYDPAAGLFEPGNFDVYATSSDIGLISSDQIDALVLSDTEMGHTFSSSATPDGLLQVDDNDEALFSLARMSPTLMGLDGAPGLVGVDDDSANGVDDLGEVGLGDDFSPADIFYTDFDGTFSLFIPSEAMGLQPELNDIDAADVKPIPPPIPAVSEWGLIVMCLMMLTAGTIVVRRRSRITQ